jgi:hypothetical protein
VQVTGVMTTVYFEVMLANFSDADAAEKMNNPISRKTRCFSMVFSGLCCYGTLPRCPDRLCQAQFSFVRICRFQRPDRDDQGGTRGNACNRFTPITQMGSGGKCARTANAHAFHAVPEACQNVPVPDGPDGLLVAEKNLSPVERNVVDEPDAIPFLKKRAAAGQILDDCDA